MLNNRSLCVSLPEQSFDVDENVKVIASGTGEATLTVKQFSFFILLLFKMCVCSLLRLIYFAVGDAVLCSAQRNCERLYKI